jgi:hypothetical protein
MGIRMSHFILLQRRKLQRKPFLNFPGTWGIYFLLSAVQRWDLFLLTCTASEKCKKKKKKNPENRKATRSHSSD